MTIAELIPILINVSIALVVLGLGLGASLGDAAHLLRHPGLLVRSILSMNVAMPVFATLLVMLFDLHPAIKVTVVALALSPVPPFLPRTEIKAGGVSAYVVSLLVITALLSVVVVPLGSGLIERAFSIDGTLPLFNIGWSLAVTVTLPLIIGMIVHDAAPGLAQRVAHAISTIGMVLLVVAFLPVVVTQWGMIWSMVGNGTLVVLTVFALVGLAVGHILGGPEPADRVVLALSTASRHPGVAIAVASAYLPHQGAVLSVVLWHLVLGAVLSGPYVKWMHLTPQAPAPKPPIKPHSPPIR